MNRQEFLKKWIGEPCPTAKDDRYAEASDDLRRVINHELAMQTELKKEFAKMEDGG
jgi:hypothetical protein